MLSLRDMKINFKAMNYIFETQLKTLYPDYSKITKLKMELEKNNLNL